MGLGKWIGSAMGFMTMGPLGALAGYFIGSWFDKQAVGMQEDLQADEAGRANYEQGAAKQLFVFDVGDGLLCDTGRPENHAQRNGIRPSFPSCEFRGERGRRGGTNLDETLR